MRFGYDDFIDQVWNISENVRYIEKTRYLADVHISDRGHKGTCIVNYSLY